MYQPDNDERGLVRAERSSSALAPKEPAPLGAYGTGGNVGGGARPLSGLLRYKWSIALVAILLAGPAIAAIWMLTKPKYAARGEIRVRPIIPTLVFQTDDKRIPFYNSYLNTQVAIIRNPEVFRRVLDKQEVRDTAWYREAPRSLRGNPPSPMERLRDDVLVRPRGRTEIIDITMTTLKPQDGATIVNAIIDEYLKYTADLSALAGDVLHRQLVEEYRSLRNELDSRRQAAAALRRDLGTGDPEELVARRRVRLDEVEARLDDLQRRIALAEWQQRELQALQAAADEEDDRPAAEPTKPPYESDPEWRRLYLDVKTAQHQLEVEGEQLGAQHPRMVALRSQGEFAERLLQERQAQLDARWRQNPGAAFGDQPDEQGITMDLVMLERQIRQLKYEEELRTVDVDKQRVHWESAFDRAQVLGRELEQIRQKEALFTAVRTKLEQKEMERNVPGSIEVLARAFASSRPTRDRPMMLTVAALAGGLMGGVGLAFLRMQRDESIYGADEVVSHARVPFLGYLPLVGDVKTPETSGVLAEGIRMVRTALLQQLDAPHGNTVLITSPGPGVGKTTVSIMLARSLAQCGKKVLLVDGDLRNSALARRMGLEGSPGLLAALKDEVREQQAIVAAGDGGLLDVLPSGRNGADLDPELLANGAFSRCIAQWRQRYDFILMDSPPVLVVADAQIMARYADGTLMIVREGYCQRADLYSALTMLGNPRDSLLGTVFIGSGRRSSYGYPYSYGGA